MTGMIAAIEWGKLLKLPLTWALIAGALALLLLIPDTGRRRRRVGIVVAAVAAACLLASFAKLGALAPTITFGALAVLTLGSACATISSRSAVYSAIWFAVSLLGTGGLLMLQDAQFLGIATIVVYAGAIVVTLLFVVMLAQPEGHDTYDRLSWGSLAKPAAVVTATVMLGLVLSAIGKTRELPASSGKSPLVASAADAAKSEAAKRASSDAQTGDKEAGEKEAGGESSGAKPSGAKPATTKRASDKGPGSSAHMARLGGQLFGRHLIAVELGGTLLLVALVGAVAIVIQGRERPGSGASELLGGAVAAARKEGSTNA